MGKFCEEPAADRLRCAFAFRNTLLRLAVCQPEHDWPTRKSVKNHHGFNFQPSTNPTPMQAKAA